MNDKHVPKLVCEYVLTGSRDVGLIPVKMEQALLLYPILRTIHLKTYSSKTHFNIIIPSIITRSLFLVFPFKSQSFLHDPPMIWQYMVRYLQYSGFGGTNLPLSQLRKGRNFMPVKLINSNTDVFNRHV